MKFSMPMAQVHESCYAVVDGMNSAEKLKRFMRLNRVYRRRELAQASTAVDRDLKTLVDEGEVLKLGPGLYGRGRRNPFGMTPPDRRELVRAFLGTDDFLLTSFNHFTGLGLGLTQVYNHCLVYNHRRGGDVRLMGLLFQFRIVRRYPKVLSKEYLLVDLLNHLGRLPDDASRVVKNLPASVREFDQDKLLTCLHRYGHYEAKRLLGRLMQKAPAEPSPSSASGGGAVVRDRLPWRIVDKEDPQADLKFWLGKSSAERVAAMEILREQYYAMSGFKCLPRLAHSIQLRERHD